jgi:hypothetical protein
VELPGAADCGQKRVITLVAQQIVTAEGWRL